MTSEEIFKTMQDLIAEQFAVNADDVTMNSSIAMTSSTRSTESAPRSSTKELSMPISSVSMANCSAIRSCMVLKISSIVMR